MWHTFETAVRQDKALCRITLRNVWLLTFPCFLTKDPSWNFPELRVNTDSLGTTNLFTWIYFVSIDFISDFNQLYSMRNRQYYLSPVVELQTNTPLFFFFPVKISLTDRKTKTLLTGSERTKQLVGVLLIESWSILIGNIKHFCAAQVLKGKSSKCYICSVEPFSGLRTKST